MDPVILKNARYCSACDEEIESHYRHDCKTCSCGEVMVDGGHDYFKSSGEGVSRNLESDDPEVIKNNLTWGTRGKDGTLPLIHKKLVDCDTDHLQAILTTQKRISPPHKTTITSILKDRRICPECQAENQVWICDSCGSALN